MRELSERQIEVIRFIAKGLANKQIAVELGLSELTVKNHIYEIFHRMNLKSRTEVAVYAARHGLLEDEEEIDDLDTIVISKSEFCKTLECIRCKDIIAYMKSHNCGN
jgi:DNA-binding CsgD family transcriptional regulator